MAADHFSRNQMIRKAVLQRPQAIPDATVRLWQCLASELIAIIGDGGFQSLYARSVYLNIASFSWLTPVHPAQGSDARFAGLQKDLEGQEVSQAGEASITLLITFIDILAVLIGDLLTASILHAAWGDDATDIAVKELQK